MNMLRYAFIFGLHVHKPVNLPTYSYLYVCLSIYLLFSYVKLHKYKLVVYVYWIDTGLYTYEPKTKYSLRFLYLIVR